MIQLREHQLRILDSLKTNQKGQVIVPTGGGKTLCMIKDAQREFNKCSWDVFLKKPERKTVVVVSPRILLAQQHSDEFEEWMGLHPMLQRKYCMYIVERLNISLPLIQIRFVNGTIVTTDIID